ncbi:GNAT family N-acetyltransferase [Hydrogenivirga sp.]
MFSEEYLKYSATQKAQLLHLLTYLTEKYDAEFIPKRILDIGCGGGNGTILLSQIFKGAEVVGIDKSEELIRVAKKRVKGDNPVFIHTDFLEFEDGSGFDMMFSNNVFHWFGHRAEEAYSKVHAFLRVGGYMCIHQGGAWSYFPLRYVMESMLREKGVKVPPYPLFYPTVAEMKELLEDVGFKKVYVERKEEVELSNRDVYIDFSYAGGLPYLNLLPEEERDMVRMEFIERCRKEEVPSLPIRLYIIGRKTDGLDIRKIEKREIPKYILQIEEILEEVDREFVPPLSQRTSTVQMEFAGAGGEGGGTSDYLSSLLSQELLLAIDRDRVIGLLSYRRNFVFEGSVFTAYVSTIAVKKGYRRLGVGKALYEELLRRERKVLVRTWSGNFAHERLLKNLGFDLYKEIKNHRGKGIDTLYFVHRT